MEEDTENEREINLYTGCEYRFRAILNHRPIGRLSCPHVNSYSLLKKVEYPNLSFLLNLIYMYIYVQYINNTTHKPSKQRRWISEQLRQDNLQADIGTTASNNQTIQLRSAQLSPVELFLPFLIFLPLSNK